MRRVEITVTRPHIAWRGGLPYVLCSGIDHLDARAMAWVVAWRDDPVEIDLAAIDAELDAEEAERDEGPPASASSAPTVTVAGPEQAQALVLDAIREAVKISAYDLSARLDLDPARRKRALRVLLDRGLIEAEGVTRGRVYRLAGQRKQPLTRVVSSASNGKQEPTIEGQVLAAVQFRAGTIAQIASRLEIDHDRVTVAMRKLEREGEVKNGSGVWGRA